MRDVKRKTDTKWFATKIRDSKHKSQRVLCQSIHDERGNPMHQMGLSRIINGIQRLELFQARQMADLLEVPMMEIIRRWGIPVYNTDLPEKFDR